MTDQQPSPVSAPSTASASAAPTRETPDTGTAPAPAPMAAPPEHGASVAFRPARPRIRFAAIVWGLLIAAAGGLLAWSAADPGRADAAELAILTAGWPVVVLELVLALGAVILLGSLLAAARRAQTRAATRRATRVG